MDFVAPVAMIALGLKFVDFLRYAKAKDINGVLTQLIAWVAGIGVVMLAAHTQWSAGIPIGNLPLSALGAWDQVFAGLALGSTASFLKDTLKSVDNSNSSAIPTLVDVGPRDRTPNQGGVQASDVG